MYINIKETTRTLALAIFCSAVALTLASDEAYASKKKEVAKPAQVSEKKKAELNKAMRKLWEDHIVYTRNFIISALADLPDKDAVSKRLLKNQDDIGDAVGKYYGDEAGKKLAKLLKDHILIAVEVVDAAKKDDKPGLDKSQKKWTENGKEIAVFLSGANKNWKQDELAKHLQTHLDLTSGEVVGRLKKDWDGDIKSYDKGHDHMLMFADILTDGVVMQFPEKFKD